MSALCRAARTVLGEPLSPGAKWGKQQSGKTERRGCSRALSGGASGTVALSQAWTGRSADLGGPQGRGERAGAASAPSVLPAPSVGFQGHAAVPGCIPAPGVPARRKCRCFPSVFTEDGRHSQRAFSNDQKLLGVRRSEQGARSPRLGSPCAHRCPAGYLSPRYGRAFPLSPAQAMLSESPKGPSHLLGR